MSGARNENLAVGGCAAQQFAAGATALAGRGLSSNVRPQDATPLVVPIRSPSGCAAAKGLRAIPAPSLPRTRRCWCHH